MAANAVTGASAAAIADLLSTNPMIRELDLSANELGPDAGPPILAALKSPQWLYPESTVSGVRRRRGGWRCVLTCAWVQDGGDGVWCMDSSGRTLPLTSHLAFSLSPFVVTRSSARSRGSCRC